ncbi:hypothetical protein BJV74DRAFT_141737 [Russula compacta]|nr:hypothetical protein BJV74DRAFT_141737 [Russula compacta]
MSMGKAPIRCFCLVPATTDIDSDHIRGSVHALSNPPHSAPAISSAEPINSSLSYMASLEQFSTIESLFQSALDDYQIQTGVDLRRHPLALQLDRCDTVQSLTETLQRQAQAFHEFRGANNKIITLLKHVAQALHKLSSPVVHAEAIGLPVSPVKTIHTCIGILLSAVKDVSASYDALVELFESTLSFLKRLDIYTKIPLTTGMTEIIVKILIQVISTLAVATKQIKQGRLKKFGKKLFRDNEIETVLHRLDRLTPEEAQMTAVQTLMVVHGLVENLRQVMSDGLASNEGIQKALEMVQQLTSDVNKSRRDQLRRDVKGWLSPPDPWQNYNIQHDAHHDGTATWFIDGDTFTEWKSSPCSLLWIHGKPGSGKSVICSTIIENIDGMRKSGLASLAFYYFDFRDVQKKHRRGLLSSLLFQLCGQSDSYYDILSDLYSTHHDGSQDPSDGALTECLEKMLCLSGQAPVYLILDALDECPNTSGTPTARENVLSLVEDLVDLRLPTLHICLTSRPEVDIQTVLDSLEFHSIPLHDQEGQKQDILDYIRSVVRSDRKTRRWRAEDKQLVIDVLSQKANGM